MLFPSLLFEFIPLYFYSLLMKFTRKGGDAMKKSLVAWAVFVLVLLAGMVQAQQQSAPAPAAKSEAAAPSLTISRMEIAASVENRQPVGIAATFPASTDKVYCYLELKEVPKDTTITYVWSLGPNEIGKVSQQVKKSSRWRTWGNKSLGGMKGDWKVAVLDESGAMLKTAAFKVE
jgi:hypothetical protein